MYGTVVKHYIFETDSLHHYLVSYFHSISTPHFTNLPHLFHHLHIFHHRNPRGSPLAPRIKSNAYRSLSFISGHQSRHYGADFDPYTLMNTFIVRLTLPHIMFRGRILNGSKHTFPALGTM